MTSEMIHANLSNLPELWCSGTETRCPPMLLSINELWSRDSEPFFRNGSIWACIIKPSRDLDYRWINRSQERQMQSAGPHVYRIIWPHEVPSKMNLTWLGVRMVWSVDLSCEIAHPRVFGLSRLMLSSWMECNGSYRGHPESKRFIVHSSPPVFCGCNV